jgi:hypothetical protein
MELSRFNQAKAQHSQSPVIAKGLAAIRVQYVKLYSVPNCSEHCD